MRRLFALVCASLLAAAPAFAQKISAFPNLPGAAAAMTDAVVTQSGTCAAGNCRTTIQQIIGAALATPNVWTAAQLVQGQLNTAFTVDTSILTGQLNNPSQTAAAIYHELCSGCQPNADAVRGVATATSGSTTSNVNGIAGYVLNNNANVNNGGNAVSVFGVVIGAVDGAESWGINLNLTDNTNGFAVSSGQRRQLLNEYDFNVTSSATTVNGLILQGASVATPALSNGFVVGNLNLGYLTGTSATSRPWNTGFLTEDASAVVGLQLGLAGSKSGNSLSSQIIALAATDASGNKSYATLYEAPGGLTLTSPAILPAANNAMSIGGPSQNVLQIFSKSVVLEPGTVSALPSCNYYTNGAIATVTDSINTSVYTNTQGGGPYHALVMCDGVEWVTH